MDTSDPMIQFDENGVCNHCTLGIERVKNETLRGEAAERQIEKIVSVIKANKSHKKYDCILGVSGGVDSTYTVWLVKQLGLTPLAVHFDNGWNSELAVKNIETVLERLDVDLYTYVVDWEEFKDVQLAFIKSSIPNLEIPTDHGIYATLYRVASQMGIRYIVCGNNIATESIMPASWMGVNPVQQYATILDIQKQFGTRPIKSLPLAGLLRVLYYTFIKRIRMINILNCYDYDKKDALTLMKDKLGYKEYAYKHYESIYTRFFQSYILPKKYKMDKRRPHLASLIASNQMTRDEALKVLEQPICDPALLEEDRQFFLKKLDLTEAEFDKIMAQPMTDYSQFKRYALIFDHFGELARKMKRIILNV